MKFIRTSEANTPYKAARLVPWSPCFIMPVKGGFEIFKTLQDTGWMPASAKIIASADKQGADWFGSIEKAKPGEIKIADIIIGQEAICPDGLGRVVRVSVDTNNADLVKRFIINSFITGNRHDWDVDKVTLVPLSHQLKPFMDVDWAAPIVADCLSREEMDLLFDALESYRNHSKVYMEDSKKPCGTFPGAVEYFKQRLSDCVDLMNKLEYPYEK